MQKRADSAHPVQGDAATLTPADARARERTLVDEARGLEAALERLRREAEAETQRLARGGKGGRERLADLMRQIGDLQVQLGVVQQMRTAVLAVARTAEAEARAAAYTAAVATYAAAGDQQRRLARQLDEQLEAAAATLAALSQALDPGPVVGEVVTDDRLAQHLQTFGPTPHKLAQVVDARIRGLRLLGPDPAVPRGAHRTDPIATYVEARVARFLEIARAHTPQEDHA